jgi:D-proline reductase (dithiol) PrdB
MARLNDLSPTSQASLPDLDCPSFERRPFVGGPPLSSRRVAIVTTAGLIRRGERPFVSGDVDYRAIPGDLPASDLLMTHVSVNFDRTAYQRDVNVVLPTDRLNEMARAGTIGSVAATHYSFMGAADPRGMEANARSVAGLLKADQIDAVVLTPV